jgi:hypothetical protein
MPSSIGVRGIARGVRTPGAEFTNEIRAISALGCSRGDDVTRRWLLFAFASMRQVLARRWALDCIIDCCAAQIVSRAPRWLELCLRFQWVAALGSIARNRGLHKVSSRRSVASYFEPDKVLFAGLLSRDALAFARRRGVASRR